MAVSNPSPNPNPNQCATGLGILAGAKPEPD